MNAVRKSLPRTVTVLILFVVILFSLTLLPYFCMARTNGANLNAELAEIAMHLAHKGKFRAWSLVPDSAVIQRVVYGGHFALAQGHFFSGSELCPFSLILWKDMFSDGWRVDGRYCLCGFYQKIVIQSFPMKAAITNGLQAISVKTYVDVAGITVVILLVILYAGILKLPSAKKKKRKALRAVLLTALVLLLAVLLPYLMKPHTGGEGRFSPFAETENVRMESVDKQKLRYPDRAEAARICEYYEELFPMLRQVEAEPASQLRYKITMDDFAVRIYDDCICYQDVCFEPIGAITMQDVLKAADNQYFRAFEG